MVEEYILASYGQIAEGSEGLDARWEILDLLTVPTVNVATHTAPLRSWEPREECLRGKNLQSAYHSHHF